MNNSDICPEAFLSNCPLTFSKESITVSDKLLQFLFFTNHLNYCNKEWWSNYNDHWYQEMYKIVVPLYPNSRIPIRTQIQLDNCTGGGILHYLVKKGKKKLFALKKKQIAWNARQRTVSLCDLTTKALWSQTWKELLLHFFSLVMLILWSGNTYIL